MKRIAIAFVIAAFAASPVYAQSCASKAVGKDGKPLAGAAKTSFMKKCCEESAKGKDGKALSGAAIPVMDPTHCCWTRVGISVGSAESHAEKLESF
jgi:hypothetical protein